MQPPETEPTRMPSSRIAASEPGGRGLAPKVCATVSSHTRRPAFAPLQRALEDVEVEALHQRYSRGRPRVVSVQPDADPEELAQIPERLRGTASNPAPERLWWPAPSTRMKRLGAWAAS